MGGWIGGLGEVVVGGAEWEVGGAARPLAQGCPVPCLFFVGFGGSGGGQEHGGSTGEARGKLGEATPFSGEARFLATVKLRKIGGSSWPE